MESIKVTSFLNDSTGKYATFNTLEVGQIVTWKNQQRYYRTGRSLCKVISKTKIPHGGGVIVLRAIDQFEWYTATTQTVELHILRSRFDYKFDIKILDADAAYKRAKTRMKHVVRAMEKVKARSEDLGLTEADIKRLFHDAETEVFVEKL
jgi:hypothetical protein